MDAINPLVTEVTFSGLCPGYASLFCLCINPPAKNDGPRLMEFFTRWQKKKNSERLLRQNEVNEGLRNMRKQKKWRKVEAKIREVGRKLGYG